MSMRAFKVSLLLALVTMGCASQTHQVSPMQQLSEVVSREVTQGQSQGPILNQQKSINDTSQRAPCSSKKCGAGFLSERIKDRFKNFGELNSVYKNGRDFEIKAQTQKSSLLFTAIHGGSLEILSDDWARILAGTTHSLYIFKSLTRDFNKDLHITSARFDEPRLLKMVSSAKVVISLHGYRSESDIVCLGGEESLKKKAKKHLGHLFKFQTQDQPPCHGLVAENSSNFIYKASQGGVQFEFPRHIREQILTEPLKTQIIEAFARFTKSIEDDF